MSEESRLGREAIETAYVLKQLVQAGVRVFFYMENRERTLDSPTDKIMLSLTTFADGSNAKRHASGLMMRCFERRARDTSRAAGSSGTTTPSARRIGPAVARRAEDQPCGGGDRRAHLELCAGGMGTRGSRSS